MQILRLHIENFGRLHDFDMELEEGFQVFCQENGWGKSTFAAFIKAMFYGLPQTARRSLKENDRKRYRPWQGGAFGGSMEFQAGKKTYRVERFFGTKDREDSFALYDCLTGLESDDYSAGLGEELFHVDRSAYERTCLFLQQDLELSASGSLNARLSRVEEDAGDMRNYEKAVVSLEEKMKYYQKTGNRGEIGRLQEEKGAVREELRVCQELEDELREWHARLDDRRPLLKKAQAEVKKAEQELQKAQEFRQMEAKREQYDLLKSQAEERQEELQKAAEALAEYTGTPPGEEKLDRYRERIYELRTLKRQEKEAVEAANVARNHLGSLMDARDDLRAPGILPGILAGFLLIIGIFCLIRGLLLPGAALLASGAGALAFGVIAGRRYQEKRAHLDQRIKESEEASHKTQSALRELQKRRDMTEKKVCEFLGVPKHTEFSELERLWGLKRKESQDYQERKQTYENRRKEAARSRERWFAYRESFTKEEQQRLSSSGEPAPDLQRLKKDLEDKRARLERFRREEQEIRYRVSSLQEKTERILELKEKEAALSEKIEKAVREHALFEKTLSYLKKAREQFSVRYLGELQDRLESYLVHLEPERKIRPLLDSSLQMKVQEAGAFRTLETQSAGQQDLLRFAQRLAVLDALYTEEQPILILDDPFVNLDTGRQGRALEQLKQLSGRRQTLLLTCRSLPGFPVPGENGAVTP